jgi:serine/threonine-protein kinase ATR
MVDAMGVTGVEGAYRRSMEVCLHLLREHKELLLSVIEPFIKDPTVSWGRGGRAQRLNDNGLFSLGASKQHAMASGKFQDMENKNAEIALRNIEQRLTGIYNICQ